MMYPTHIFWGLLVAWFYTHFGSPFDPLVVPFLTTFGTGKPPEGSQKAPKKDWQRRCKMKVSCGGPSGALKAGAPVMEKAVATKVCLSRLPRLDIYIIYTRI